MSLIFVNFLKKKDCFDLGSPAFSAGVMIPIVLLVCLLRFSEQLVSCFYAFMNFSCHPGRLILSFHSLCLQWNVANKNLIKHFSNESRTSLTHFDSKAVSHEALSKSRCRLSLFKFL